MTEVIVSIVVLVLGVVGGAVAAYTLVSHRERDARELRDRAIREREANRATANALTQQEADLQNEKIQLDAARKQLEAGYVTVADLEREVQLLKRQLVAHRVTVRGLELRTKKQADRELQLLDLVRTYLKENNRWIKATLTPGNYEICRRRLAEVINRCRTAGVDYPQSLEQYELGQLQKAYESAVHAAAERERQARLRADYRDEQRRQQQIQEELDRAEAERRMLEEAIARVRKESNAQHSIELEQLQKRLAEAEARTQRATSQAQLTRHGHVYVISNIGAFGEGVFKIGMTRRLTPQERVDELSGAAVPFGFDVHMMIECEDAPRLESTLHDELHLCRVNRVNPRKEFFRTDLEAIRAIVEKHHGEVSYIATAEALEYREGLTLTVEQQERIEELYRDEREIEDDDEISNVEPDVSSQ